MMSKAKKPRTRCKKEPMDTLLNVADIKSEPVDGKPSGKKQQLKQEKITDMCQVRKKRDRFNGMSEDEILMKTLPDHLDYNLDIVIIGINPGLTAAHVGHHYAGPGNHFWKCLHLCGLTADQMNAYDDYKLKEVGIGFTNIVERTSRSSADLSRTEIKQGAEILSEKIKKYRPKIAAFNGKGIYEIFCGHKNFFIGRQPEPYPDTDTVIFVMPSSSARCSQLPRAVDKLPFYVALRKLRDHLRGDLAELDYSEVIFPDLDLKVEPKREREDLQVKTEPGCPENSASPAKRGRKKSVGNTKQENGFLLKVDIKTEPNLVLNRRSRRFKVQTTPTCGPVLDQSSTCTTIIPDCSHPVISPYFTSSLTSQLSNGLPSWSGQMLGGHQLLNGQVKEEVPFDQGHYGLMPNYAAHTNSTPGVPGVSGCANNSNQIWHYHTPFTR